MDQSDQRVLNLSNSLVNFSAELRRNWVSWLDKITDFRDMSESHVLWWGRGEENEKREGEQMFARAILGRMSTKLTQLTEGRNIKMS